MTNSSPIGARRAALFRKLPRTRNVAWLFAALAIIAAQPSAAWSQSPSPPAAAEAAANEFSAADLEFFEKKVRPLLAARCYECHGPQAEEPKGGLRVDSRQALLNGGDTGPAIAPGKPQESLLIDSVNYGDVYQMPPRSKLPEKEIAVLTEWVQRGAPWPAEQTTAPSASSGSFSIAERRDAHWSWAPIQPTPPPATANTSWPRQPLDSFLLARLEEKQLEPAELAEGPALLRRLYFDLTGLPPPPDEAQAFLQLSEREQEQEYLRIVDRLLASPAFGERFARHWLDLVRYAESRGHEFDYDAANAWQYRDYVIRAWSSDLPYDQFVIEHVAGDLLQTPRLHPQRRFNESVLATGFWHLGEWVHSPVDIRQDETDRFDNMIDVFGKAFLGLTVACARCHDHKFDAISQRDYYALSGYLQSCDYRQVRFETMEQHRDVARRLQELAELRLPAILKAVAGQLSFGVDRTSDYLLAAAKLLRETANSDAVGALARERRLSPDQLTAWRNALQPAVDSHDDFLHRFASAAISGDPASGEAASGEPIVGEPNNSPRQTSDPAAGGAVINYQSAPQALFMPDGPTFGTGPLRAGDLLTPLRDGGDALRFASYGAARRDLRWRGLSLSPGVQGESGKLAGVDRAGKSLRTPTFTLTGQQLHYLVRGAGYAYAVVDSHRMVNGPLHGELWIEFHHDDAPTWVTHNLPAYQGHQAHIEFIARGQAELEVLRVEQSPQAPYSPPRAADLAPAGESLVELAAAYQSLLEQTIERAASSSLAGAADSGQRAAIMNWLLTRHRSLFGEAPAASAQVESLLAAYEREQQAILKEVTWESQTAMAMWDGDGVDDRLLIRGNSRTPAEVVARGMLEAIAGPRQPSPPEGSGRLELAQSLVDRSNPFTSRVIVNRLWKYLFAEGLAPSVDNLGVLGQAPTHPELLDFLADRFMRRGWSVKQLVREIVTSSAYRMSSRNPAGKEADPANALWHQARIRRLEGEAIRDTILAVSGRLDRRQFGPSVPVHLTAFLQGRGRPAESGPLDGAGRRSIYLAVRRNFLSPMMLAFDAPIPLGAVGRRNVSNVPAQALIMLNDPFVYEQARRWAEDVLAHSDKSFAGRLNRMYFTAYSRPPTATETARAEAFLRRQGQELGLPEQALSEDVRIWTDLCHVLMNAKEFVFVN